MKVAVLSDIQANFPAMKTVCQHILDWQPDRVIMNGDLVNRGPRSLDCLQYFCELEKEHGWIPVRGNHEDFVRFCQQNPPTSDNEALLRRFTDWTANQLGDAAALTDPWPDHYCFHAAEDISSWVHVTHGSIESNRRGILANTTEEELASRVPMGLSLFITAHTHRPIVRKFKGVTIVNVGSAGSPFDGDERASYAQLTHRENGWNVEMIRLPYDREAADRDFHETGFLEQGGPVARLVYEEWKRATGFMPLWHRDYQQRVMAGEIEANEAVELFLASLAE